MTAAVLRAMRPDQWTKNLLVFAAPATAGVLDEGPHALDAVLSFVAFCLLASATYLLNDVLDREHDSRHPVKRDRPVAAGVLSVRAALAAGAVLLVAGLAGGAATGRAALVAVLVGYVALTAAYSTVLKDVAVVDLAAVAGGFLLRAVAGGAAVDVPLSDWFLIVATFGSIFLVSGRRHAEHVRLGADGGAHRATLGRYSLGYLGHVRTLASAVMILAYCLWALERGEGLDVPWFGLSIVPFVLGVLRYELLVEEGHGGEPEQVLLRDRGTQALVAVWTALILGGVYVG